ncbi:hypothetical protein B9Z19DRAFT_1128333 [Tuber borchii]|uniref:Uncharacterized protein n=1 Tax=Tuber borchii TaxID=42251 RepID=A0A2T6ZPM3_TUBBO|nr:hypothetical protein B9Z19DRAFT_1128333 [Tuber borchii]
MDIWLNSQVSNKHNMSATSAPITPEAFLAAIKDLELEQLHAEAARLRNSLYHLARSNIALQEFQNDPELKEAIDDNEITIQRQKQRVQMIVEEIQRRGFPTDHVILGNTVNAVNGERGNVDTREGRGQEEEDGDPVTIARPEPPAGAREEEVHVDDLGEGGVYL